ncbi:MAG: hypothetical protein SVK08_09195 [Halobacteriota archaeon]|nr:hypothetical protein [Halobacteriota archaeon]
MANPRKPKCAVCGKGVDVFGSDADYLKVVRKGGSGAFYHEKCYKKEVIGEA